MNQTKRLFVAIDLPQEVIAYLEKIQIQIKQEAFFEGTYPKLEHMHLTLIFLGQVPASESVSIEAALDAVKGVPMQAQLGRLSIFMHHAFVKIIFVDVVCPGLNDLFNSLQQTLERWVSKERYEFVSHVTLARAKHVHDEQGLEKFVERYEVEPRIFTINSFVLKESELTSEGPIHRILARYGLSNTKNNFSK